MSPPSAQTHYRTLGVPPSATPDHIRRAYRALAKVHHPDVSSDKHASKMFARIAAAYAVLSDRRKRAAYDRTLGKRPPRPGPAQRDAEDPRQGHYTWVSVAGGPSKHEVDLSEVDELFDTFFSGAAKSKGGRKPASGTSPTPTRGKPKQPRKPAS